MSTATTSFVEMSPEELAQHSEVQRYFFRITSAEFTECECCKQPLHVAFEAFSESTESPTCREACVGGFCIPCVILGGRPCISAALRSMAKEYVETEDEGVMKNTWRAIGEQFRRGLFEIQMPDSVRDMALAMSQASAKKMKKDEAIQSRLLGMLEGAGK